MKKLLLIDFVKQYYYFNLFLIIIKFPLLNRNDFIEITFHIINIDINHISYY